MRSPRNKRRGNQLLEFALIAVPLFGLLFGIIDFAFAIFVRSTMEHSVREGVRYAATYRLKAGKCQADSIKDIVQESSMGFLSTHRDKIKVRFFNPEADALGMFAEVTVNGNKPGNIVEVAIEDYEYKWIVPLYWGSDPMKIKVRSADRLEGVATGSSPPCV